MMLAQLIRQQSQIAASTFLRRGYTNVNKAQLQQKMAAGTTLIDVRNPDEVAETGRVQHGKTEAQILPVGELQSALGLSEADFKKKYKFDKPKPDQEIIFTCRSGKRSVVASNIAESMGMRNVFNYTGGAGEWFQK